MKELLQVGLEVIGNTKSEQRFGVEGAQNTVFAVSGLFCGF